MTPILPNRENVDDLIAQLEGVLLSKHEIRLILFFSRMNSPIQVVFRVSDFENGNHYQIKGLSCWQTIGEAERVTLSDLIGYLKGQPKTFGVTQIIRYKEHES